MSEECGFRVERGSYFIGLCLLKAGHEGRHDPIPLMSDEEYKRRYGIKPFVERSADRTSAEQK